MPVLPTEYVSLNSVLIPKSQLNITPFNSGVFVYEVIRLYKGVPLFWEAHWKRLSRSLKAFPEIVIPQKNKLEANLLALIQKNNFGCVNIRIDINADTILMYGIKGKYPSVTDFEKGVSVSLYEKEREEPNLKIYRNLWKQQLESDLIASGVFEFLLVNKQGCITEGSRSNVFFIKENGLYSSQEALILPGITREEVLDIAIGKKIKVAFLPGISTNLTSFDAAFLCGTSINVLPIASIGNQAFNVNNTLLRTIQDAYNKRFNQAYLKAAEQWTR